MLVLSLGVYNTEFDEMKTREDIPDEGILNKQLVFLGDTWERR